MLALHGRVHAMGRRSLQMSSMPTWKRSVPPSGIALAIRIEAGKTKGLSVSLPRAVRGTFDSAVSSLMPQIIVREDARLRATFRRCSGNCRSRCRRRLRQCTCRFRSRKDCTTSGFSLTLWCCVLSSTAGVIAGSAKRQSPVHASCLQMRSAPASPRNFSMAVARGLQHHAAQSPFNKAVIVGGLNGVQAQLSEFWHGLPRGNVQQMADVAAKDDWAQALLNEAWAGQRAQVRDLYVASDPELKSFSKLEEL